MRIKIAHLMGLSLMLPNWGGRAHGEVIGQQPLHRSALQWTEAGLHLQVNHADGRAEAKLLPGVQIEQQWYSINPLLDCLIGNDLMKCPVAGLGQLTIAGEAGAYRLSFKADRDLTLEAIGWTGQLQLPGVKGWLSNGLQSWSQTGVLAPQKTASQEALKQALSQTGEDEVYRRGTELSWWMSYIGNDQLSFFAGATSAEKLRSYVQFPLLTNDRYKLRLISGAGEKVHLKSGEHHGESWFISLDDDLQKQLDAYAERLPSRRRQQPRPSLLGWNSWYDLWEKVSETSFLANAEAYRQLFVSRLPADTGPITMMLDDGWQKKWGDWSPNEKFPSGLKGLAEQVEAKGFQLGLWLAPMLADPKSEIVKEHPEWFIKDVFYKNPSGTQYRVLDITQKAVVRHLQTTIRRLVAAGVRAIKIDFLFAAAFEGPRARAVNGLQAYHETLACIREAAGDDIFILAVGALPIASFPYVDAWRVGGDIAFQAHWTGIPQPGPSFIGNQARSIAGRQAFCQVTLCDGDPALFRVLPRDLVYAGGWVAAASGGAMVVSDNLTLLSPERLDWAYDQIQLKNGLSGRPAQLESYFPSQLPAYLNSMKDNLFSAEHQVPEVWRMPDGTRVAMNFSLRKKMIEGIEVPKFSSRILPLKN